MFWPCPSETPEGIPQPKPEGTRRLFEPGSWNSVAKGDGPFFFPDGRARFNVPVYTPPAEDVDAEYPLILTTGRVVSQFLSGTQTRRIGPLVDHYPEPRVELHPRLAKQHEIADGEWVTVESRRGNCTFRARVLRTIRPDTIFIPYHWPGRKSANQLTISAQDPISEIARLRPRSRPVHDFRFGRQRIRTKVNMMVPSEVPSESVDVTSALDKSAISHDVTDDLFMENLFESDE